MKLRLRDTTDSIVTFSLGFVLMIKEMCSKSIITGKVQLKICCNQLSCKGISGNVIYECIDYLNTHLSILSLAVK